MKQPRPVIVHQIACCMNCGEDWDLFHHPEHRAAARRHAEKLRHHVNVETGTSTYFGPPLEETHHTQGRPE